MATAETSAIAFSEHKWTSTKVHLKETNRHPLPERCYIFFDRNLYFDMVQDDRVDILKQFNIPRFAATDTCTMLNGFFGCAGTYDCQGKLETYCTWFRLLTKRVLRSEEKNTFQQTRKRLSKKEYIWFEMGFFTFWSKPDFCRILCIGTPPELQLALQADLMQRNPGLEFKHPFGMFAPLIDQIVELYDDSVWRLRDPIRKIERGRRNGARPNFDKMHEVSRHTIHLSEVLSVALDTFEGIQEQFQEIHERLPATLSRTATGKMQNYMKFQFRAISGLRSRSESLRGRLQSEISLAYNTIAQQDNSVMKSIALLTMSFLPATFVSLFFTFERRDWEYSKNVWVYWVVAIPSTLVVLFAWRMWLRARVPGQSGSNMWKTTGHKELEPGGDV